MDRPSSLRTTHVGFFTPYRYGEHKWEDYHLDRQMLVYEGSREQVEVVERVGRQITEQSDRQVTLLQDYIASAEGAWDRVGSQLDTLTDQMVTRVSSLSHQLKRHEELLDEIIDQLGHIAQTIANPLSTQANELVRSGQHLMQRGLYREAYRDFVAAEEKRSVNPMLHYYLTRLHFEVVDDGIPLDLTAAEVHSSLSIRYATSLRGDFADGGAAVFDFVFGAAARLALVKGSNLETSGGMGAGAAELRRGDTLLRQIDEPSTDSQFLHAQILALLDRRDESVAIIRTLADFTRSWIPRALVEPNLAAVADGVRNLSKDLRQSPGVYSTMAYRAIARGRGFAKRCRSKAKKFYSAVADLAPQIDAIERDFEIGAIDARACESATSEAVNAAGRRILDKIALTIEELSATSAEAATIAHGHTKCGDDMRRDERRGLGMWGIYLPCLGAALGFFILYSAVMPGSGSRFLQRMDALSDATSAGALGAVLGAFVLTVVGFIGKQAINYLKHVNNRVAIDVADASALAARAKVEEFERQRAALGRLREDLAGFDAQSRRSD